MNPETKEILYIELQEILILMEDMDNNMAIIKLEDLINKIQYNQL
jgi:hypothetical protein